MANTNMANTNMENANNNMGNASTNMDNMDNEDIPFDDIKRDFFNTPTDISTKEPRSQAWREFATNGCDSGVLHDTGYSVDVHDVIWQKYSNLLRAYLSACEIPVIFVDELEFAAYYYHARSWIHRYPRWNKNIPSILNNYKTGPVSVQKFYAIVVPILLVLSALMDEIDEEDKYHPLNHGSHFLKYAFTSIFDGTNIDISNLRAYDYRHIQKALFCGSKYNHCCFKLMFGITFMGIIIHYSGPHIGTMNDAKMVQLYPPNFKWWEWGIGDGAFEETPHIMVKIQQPDGGVLTKGDVAVNTVFNYWRLRIEHLMADIKKPDLLSGVYRGSYPLLKAGIDITVHSQNINRKLRLPRYETCGPWPHWPVGSK